MYFYYTRWTWKNAPDVGDGCGPYHTTLVTDTPPEEILDDVVMKDLSEHFIKVFESEEEMNLYWKTLDKA